MFIDFNDYWWCHLINLLFCISINNFYLYYKHNLIVVVNNPNGQDYRAKITLHENAIPTKDTPGIKEGTIRNGVFHIIKIQLKLRCHPVVPDGNISNKILLQNSAFLPSIKHLSVTRWIGEISWVSIKCKTFIEDESTPIKDKVKALHEQQLPALTVLRASMW